MKEIKLNNRDGADLRLRQITEDSDLYRLTVDDEHKYCLEYIGVSASCNSENKVLHYHSIDPVGGPLLVAFDEIDNYIIEEIINCNTLKLREKNRDY